MEQELTTISAHRASYERRFQRVIDYVHENLERDLDLNVLADIACMSPYHWHRIYQAFSGESLAATVKRLRLQRAAGLLAKTEQSIEQIAQACAYPNVQSFTRIFSSVYGMPPARYRKEGSHKQFSLPQHLRSETMFTVEIKDVPAMHLLGLPHQGNYMGIGQAFDQLQGVAASRQLFGPQSRSIGIYWDDPSLVAEAELRSCACLVVSAEQQANQAQAPLQAYDIDAAKCAVLNYQGPYSDMHAAYEWLFGVWLPASGYEAADAAVYEEYLNDPRDTAPRELKTAIYLALRSA
jgi:AraC family transcriptional regulator